MTISFIIDCTDLRSGKRYRTPASRSYMVPNLQADNTTLWCHSVDCCGENIIMGAPLMRHFVVIFDLHNKTDQRVGFAPQQKDTCPAPPSPPRPSPPPPPGPGPEPGPIKRPWWEVLLWTTAALVSVVGILLFLKHHHIGPIAWFSAIVGRGDRGVVGLEHKELRSPLISEDP